MKSQDHSQCSSHVVQGELLPRIDDDIDNVLGLTVFYQNVLSAAINSLRQRQYVSVFTTEVFAYYLCCKLLAVTQYCQVTQMSLPDVSQQCAKYISEMHQLFIGDEFIFNLLKSATKQNDCDKPVTTHKAELDISELVELVQQSAVEHLTTVRHIKAHDFRILGTIVTTDFEALYSYKHGDYQRCLQLSTQNISMLWNTESMLVVVANPFFTVA